MFDYIKGCIPNEPRSLFTFNYNIYLYITRSSEKFQNTTAFGTDNFNSDGAKLWN